MRRLLVLALVVLASGLLHAQEDDLDLRLARLAERLEAARAEQHVAGMSIAVVTPDRVLMSRGFGRRDVQRRLPATDRTVYAIGSSTKAFAAMLVALAAADGRMDLDDPVRDHLPDFHLADPEADRQVTIRDLLSHRTGMMRNDLLWASGRASREEILARMGVAEAFAPFRKQFHYNNVQFLAAGMATESATGRPWDELLHERILEPLAMHSTSVSLEGFRAATEEATGYDWREESGAWVRLEKRDLARIAPAGAINSNVRDMGRWVRFLLGKGQLDGRRLIASAAIDEMWTSQIAIGPAMGYGLGWMLGQWEGHRLVQHGGNIDGFTALVAMLPDDGYGFVLLLNENGSPFVGKATNIVFGTLLGEFDPGGAAPTEGPALTEDELAPYLGKYRFEEMKADVTAVVKDGRLALDVPGQTVYALRWPGEDGRWVFQLTDEIVVRFTPGDDGPMRSITLYQAGLEFVLERVTETPEPPISLEDLAALRRRGRPGGDVPGRYRMTGTVDFVNTGIDGRATMTVDGERFVLTLDLGDFGRIDSGHDGRTTWAASTFEPTRHLSGDLEEQTLLSHPATIEGDWERFESIEPVERTEFEGRPVYAVALTPKTSPKHTVYVDVETGRVLGERHAILIPGAGAMPVQVVYDDHRPIGGLVLPHRVEMSNQFQGKVVLEFETAEEDPELAEDAFAPPR